MIENLIPDVYRTIQDKGGWFDESLETNLSGDLARRLRSQLGEKRGHATLRLSKMGPICPRALWCSIRHPELAEPIPPWAEVKYTFGHIIEGLTLALIKASGHEVRGEQDELVFDGIVGHRDAVVDGYVVDIKSTSSIGFQKFKNRSIAQSDSFGYLEQLDGYILASADDPLVRHKRTGYLLAVDKQLGHLVLYKHEVTDERERNLRERIAFYKRIVGENNPPVCECKTIAQGASGNLQLGVKESYSPYKHCCFPNLRTFLYASGPVYLTKVVRTPDVPEVTRRESAWLTPEKREILRGLDVPPQRIQSTPQAYEFERSSTVACPS